MNRPIHSRIVLVISVSTVLALMPAALAQRGGFHGGGGFGGFHGGGFHSGGAFHGGGSGFHNGGFSGFHGGGFHGAGPEGFGGFHNGFGRFGGGFGGFRHGPFFGGFGYPWFGLGFDFGFWPYWSYPYWSGYGPWWGPYAYAYPYDPYGPYGSYNSYDPPSDRDRRERRDPCDYRYPDTCRSKGNTAPVTPSNLNVRAEPSAPVSLNPDPGSPDPGDASPIVDDSHPAISFIAYRSAASPEDVNHRSAVSLDAGNDSPVKASASSGSPPLRPAVKNAIRLLRAMPPAARERRLNSGRYDSFSAEERELLVAAVR
jgi:hypothetical protein